ncbi:MAG: asparagine synthase (glutamine-hydrolyzing) [Saprospiraceae bacterium]|nr:asparagine synthase (glutamine-hydrolyzing) [Saprospiraceae bacterium]
MCGIFGYIGNHSVVDKNRIHNLLSHRGPDDSGALEFQNLLFMFWRLAIQDLSPLGHQPMSAQNENFWIIFNGEIYNHWEIRNELAYKYNFNSSSDTETILNGYIEYGDEIFNKLNGIFALAILDKKKNELIIARDQFGVKPLYYYSDNDRFIFTSESKAIVELTADQLHVDPKGIMNYLFYLWSPGQITSFQEIHKLEAGHYIAIDLENPTKFQSRKYYEIPFSKAKEIKDYRYWQDELEEKLLNAVERQLLADVPVGFFLSGGLDSSLLVAMYRKLYPGKKIKAYTISTGKEFQQEGFSDDLSYAKLVAQKLDVDLTICESKMDMLNDFDQMIYHLDEPQADLAPLHVRNICKRAREEGYIVLLSGAGGDDLFTGYRRHQMITQSRRLNMIPFGTTILKMIRNFTSEFSQRRIDKYISANRSKNLTEALAQTYAWLDENRLKSLFTEKYKSLIADYKPASVLLESLNNIPEEKEVINQCLYWDIKYFLTDHNLNYTDKLSMAEGVEVRVPYLDKELVEFSSRLPVEYKLQGTTTKFILRKLAEKYLPHEVIYRAKTGFGAPIRSWIKNDLDEWVNTRLSRKEVEKIGIFNYDEIQKLIKDNKENKIDAAYTILSLIAIQENLNVSRKL